MRIEVLSKNVDVTPAIYEIIQKKAAKVALFLPEDCIIRFMIDANKKRHKIEATVVVDGTIIRAEQRSDDLYKTIDRTIDVLVRRIKTYKEKRFEKKGAETIRKDCREEIDNSAPIAVRKKTFPISALTVEDACAEMELLGHSFYVFIDAESETNQICVVYKREDGGYGVLAPTC